MLFLFERELVLTPEQRGHFVEMLKERERAVEGVHEKICRENVMSRAEYVTRIEVIKQTGYARMGECLGVAQERRFREILAEGRFGDAIVFEHPPGLVVVE